MNQNQNSGEEEKKSALERAALNRNILSPHDAARQRAEAYLSDQFRLPEISSSVGLSERQRS